MIHEIISALYYSLWALILLYELGIVTDTETALEYFSYKDLPKEEREVLLPTDKLKTYKAWESLQSLYMILTIISLFTSQWYVAVVILGISVISTFFKKKYGRSVIGERLDALVCALLILFMILNRYHFHLDLF